MKNWLPEPITNSPGREFAKLSFMAPFLRLSVFAEDDVSIFFTYFDTQLSFGAPRSGANPMKTITLIPLPLFFLLFPSFSPKLSTSIMKAVHCIKKPCAV